MSYSGSYNTYNIRAYTDAVLHELQQKESLLNSIVQIEKGMGERLYFDKLGATDDVRVRTARLEDIHISEDTFERRLVSPQRLEKVHVPMDDMQRDRWARDVSPEVVMSMVAAMNRKRDAIIAAAIANDVTRELDGTASTVSFNAAFNIAVNDNEGTAYTGDTGLHEGKLIKAKALLLGAYNDPNEIPIVVANAKTLAGLTGRAFNASNGNSAGFFQQSLPKVHAGSYDQGLDGMIGMRFVCYEGLGVDGSADNLAYVIMPGALKLGEWQPLMMKEAELSHKSGFPKAIAASMSLGSVRMFEEKIVRIKCDPTNAFATA